MSYYYGWKPYVPVATRQANALRKMKKLEKNGMNIQPVQPDGRKIAKTFWGTAWCDHIESFSDFENRLPRGRTYIRNGSVCHLSINAGKIEGIVAGSELYKVNITIKKLSTKKWDSIKTACSGKISSLLDLLYGRLSDGVMDVVCNRNNGLFPLQKEIELHCNCPDWATMCKHVAAVLYGIGTRLDNSPEQLFLLRGVNHEELVDISTAVTDATQDRKTKRRLIDESALSDVFDIDLVEKDVSPIKRTKTSTTLPKKKEQNKIKKRKTKPVRKINKPTFPKLLTGVSIRKQRKVLGLTQADFAKIIGVSATTVSKWENKGRKKINPLEKTMKGLRKAWRKKHFKHS